MIRTKIIAFDEFKIDIEKRFFDVCNESQWEIHRILDIDAGKKVISFLKNENVAGRYYDNYKMVIIYEYDLNFFNEDKSLEYIKCYVYNKKIGFVEHLGYLNYWQTLLRIYLPSLFFHLRVPYKVKLVECRPPFLEENIDIVRQESNVNHENCEIPIFPEAHYFLLEIKGICYVCKQAGQIKLIQHSCYKEGELCNTNNFRESFRIIGIEKNKFFSEWGCFEILPRLIKF